MANESIQQNKKLVWEFWQHLNESLPDDMAGVIRSYVGESISWHGPHPINGLKGVDAVIEQFWRPLRAAFPDLKRRCDFLIGGHQHWVGSIGYFDGTFTHPWLGIPATGRPIHIKYGEFSALYDGKIVLTYIILDVLDVLRQAGFELIRPGWGRKAPCRGPRRLTACSSTSRTKPRVRRRWEQRKRCVGC